MPEARPEHSELYLQHQASVPMQPPEVEQQVLGRAEGRISGTQQQPSQQRDQHYATLVSALKEALQTHKVGKAPVTWEEFETFMLDRFSCQNAGETIRRLRHIRCDGSLERLAARFDAVLAEGDSPSEAELVRIFLSRLPFRLVRLVCRQHFDTWIAAKEALREALASEERARQLWLIDAPPELVREEEAATSFRQQQRSHRPTYQPHHLVPGGNPANEREFRSKAEPPQKSRNKEHRTADSSNTSVKANNSESTWRNGRSEQKSHPPTRHQQKSRNDRA
ncbi:hypothetical protein ACSSS7_008286 [Eimeria intestinalis]